MDGGVGPGDGEPGRGLAEGGHAGRPEAVKRQTRLMPGFRALWLPDRGRIWARARDFALVETECCLVSGCSGPFTCAMPTRLERNLGRPETRGIRVTPRGPRDSALSGYYPDMEALEKK